MKNKVVIFLLYMFSSYFLRSQTLLAEYNFTGASATDNSGNGNTGAIFGTSTTGNVLVIGSNITDYFTAPAGPLNNKLAFSIAYKVKFTAFNVSAGIPTNHIISGDNPGLEGAVGMSYQKSVNKWRLALNSNLYDFFDNSILENKWYCVTVTRDASGTIKLYIDGVQHQSVYNNNSLTYVTSLLLGQETDCTGGCFDVNQCSYAMIDDFKIYSGAIGQATIDANCTACTSPSTPLNATQPNNNIICGNTTTTLSAVGSGTLQWFSSSSSTVVLNTGNNFITPVLSAGVYTYYVGALTCTQSPSRAAIQVTVNSLPNVTLSGSNIVCLGTTNSLIALGATTYIWSNGSAQQTISISPTINTTYTVTGTDQFGCSNTASFSITVDKCTGLPGSISNASFLLKIYPNPVMDVIKIELNQDSKFEIISDKGQTILTGFLNQGINSLNLSNFPKGLYTIKLNTSTELITRKILKVD